MMLPSIIEKRKIDWVPYIVWGLFGALVVGVVGLLFLASGNAAEARGFCEAIGKFAIEKSGGGYLCINGVPAP